MKRGLGPALAGVTVLLTLCGLLFASAAAVSADAEDPAAPRRTPTPSDTPTTTLTPLPTVSEATPPAPAATPAAEIQSNSLVRVFDDLAHLVVTVYPDGSISFWRAHPDRGDWGFMAWLDATAQPGPAGALILDVNDEGWRLTVQRIDECGGPSPEVPTDSAAWRFYAAQVVARMMCDGRAMYYVWLWDPAGQRVAEGAFVP